MKAKNRLSKIFSGLTAALLAIALVPVAALAMSQPATLTADEGSYLVSPAFDALEIFAQEQHVLTPRSAGAITNDTTVFDPALPASTIVLYVIGGTVNATNPATGEWLIGSNRLAVYEAINNGTSIIGNPAVGDSVIVVGKRTLTAGPIVAKHIRLEIPAPQPDGESVVTTAYLLNGAVTANTTALWTVAGVDFNILPIDTQSAVGPTSIEAGLGLSSNVTVEFSILILTPNVITDGANPSHNGATLNGNLDQMGSAASVDVYFEYGANTSYGTLTPRVAKTSTGSFNAAVSGLQPATTYHYRAKADGGVRNGGDSGADMTFTTAPLSAPGVRTEDASSITATSAMLNGNLENMGTANPVNVSFVWGTASGSLTNETPAQATASTGPFSMSLNNLVGGTTYFYKAKADGGVNGVTLGAGKQFTATAETAGTGGTGGTGSGGSGSSGSGSGSSGPSTAVVVSGMTADTELKVDNSGKSQNKVKLSNSGPGKPMIEIPAGTVMKSGSGKPLNAITMSAPASVPPAPPQNTVMVPQEMGPSGATFDPAITVTMTFDPAALPDGVDKKALKMAFWDGGKWVTLDSTVDTVANTVSAKTTHFTTFAVLSPAAGPVLAPKPGTIIPETKPEPEPPPPPPPSPPATVLPEPEPKPEPEDGATTPAAPAAPLAAPEQPARSNWGLIGGILLAAVVIATAVILIRRKNPA